MFAGKKQSHIMTATFEMGTEELNMQFFKSLKTLFGQKTIKISVTDGDEIDATTYLFSNAANAAFLEEKIKYVENGGELVSFSVNDFREMSEKLMAQ